MYFPGIYQKEAEKEKETMIRMGEGRWGKGEGRGRNEHSEYVLKNVLIGLSVLLEFKASQR